MKNMRNIKDILQSEFGKLHAKFRTVSIIHLKELKSEIHEWKRKGLINREFYKKNYDNFIFKPPKTLINSCSIIIIGIPQRIIPVKFFHNGIQYHTVIPPTYVYSELQTACTDILFRILKKKGYSFHRAILPLKLLAVKSGLGKYGKNNICYIDGMGSFTRLEAFYTDYRFSTDDWYEKQVMDTCYNCSLCQNACPTNCILKDRFLINADHCLTSLNENKGDFPLWVSILSHNALVGCMRCQIVCPKNKKFLQLLEDPLIFSQEETSILLQKTPRESIPQKLAKKLVDFDIDEYYLLLGRNLSVLMNKY